MSDEPKADGVSRRRFLGATATGAAALPLVGGALGVAHAEPPQAQAANSPLVPVSLNVNGQKREIAVDPRTTLLDALRNNVGLTGTKKGCDHGQCGACTVHLDGRSINACMILALTARNHAITTIEGLASDDGTLHPVQQAFIDHDAFQCGYCTSGQIMTGVACITSGAAGSDASIREYMSGNLCRCAAYPNIVAAIKDARTKMGA